MGPVALANESMAVNSVLVRAKKKGYCFAGQTITTNGAECYF